MRRRQYDRGRRLHGDLHPGNLIVHKGKLAAVIDFGDLCAGELGDALLRAEPLDEAFDLRAVVAGLLGVQAAEEVSDRFRGRDDLGQVGPPEV